MFRGRGRRGGFRKSRRGGFGKSRRRGRRIPHYGSSRGGIRL